MRGFSGYLSIVIIYFIIVTPLVFLRFKMSFGDSKTNKEIIKIALIINSVIVLFFITIEILDNNLPKHDVGIDITIHNKNDLFVEINIDGIFYRIRKNETININNIKSFSGFIAIKTSNNARIWLYTNEKSVFKNNKNVKIKISNKNIKINNFMLKITPFVKNYEWYDAILKFLLEEKQNGIINK